MKWHHIQESQRTHHTVHLSNAKITWTELVTWKSPPCDDFTCFRLQQLPTTKPDSKLVTWTKKMISELPWLEQWTAVLWYVLTYGTPASNIGVHRIQLIQQPVINTHSNHFTTIYTIPNTRYYITDWHCIIRLMLYTRLASPVAVCIDIPRRYTQLAWPANPNPNPDPNPTNPSYG